MFKVSDPLIGRCVFKGSDPLIGTMVSDPLITRLIGMQE